MFTTKSFTYQQLVLPESIVEPGLKTSEALQTTHEPASLFQEHLLLPPLQRFCTRLLQQDHL